MGCYPARHLEGSYISLGDLNDWNVVGVKKLYYFDNGSTTWELSTHDNKWHVRWVLRERGITLAGLRPEAMLKPVSMHKMLDEVRGTMLRDEKMFEEDLQAPLSFCNSRFGQSFFVLQYCRMLHTLYTGTVQSKKAGMEWAKKVLDRLWIELIDQAWHERQGVRFGIKIGQRAEQALVNRTLEFMRYIINQHDDLFMSAG